MVSPLWIFSFEQFLDREHLDRTAKKGHLMKKTLLLAALVFLGFSGSAQAQITVDFKDNATYDNIGAGFSQFLEDTNQPGRDLTFNLDSITGGTVLRTNAAGLGEGSNRRFENGQDIGFHYDTLNGDGGVAFEQLTFKAHTQNTEIFTLSSEDFKGRGYGGVSWGAGIEYVEADGEFRFTNLNSLQDTTFDLSAKVVRADSGSTVRLGFETAGGLNAAWETVTVSAVPEPGSIGLLSACGFGFVLYRRRRQAKQKAQEESEA